MIAITQEMLDRIHTDSDIMDLADELNIGYGELDYAISNKHAEGTPCHNCKHVNIGLQMMTYPCIFCSRVHTEDHYEHIDIEREED